MTSRDPSSGPFQKLTATLFNSDNLPKFLPIEAFVEKLAGHGLPVTRDIVFELAQAGRLPCFFFGEDKSSPFFLWKDASRWIKDNLIYCSEGSSLEVRLIELVAANPVSDGIPHQLAAVDPLFKYSITNQPVVYFLCRAGRVVYVGQSTNLGSRIGQHQADKDFDSVFYVLVPQRDLNRIERKFIEAIQPVYNQTFMTPALVAQEMISAANETHAVTSGAST